MSNFLGVLYGLLEHVLGAPFVEPSGDACDRYHRYPDDIARLADNVFLGSARRRLHGAQTYSRTRFGLDGVPVVQVGCEFWVGRATQARAVKPSAVWLGQAARANALPIG